MTELFCKNSQLLSPIFTKSFIIYVRLDSKYASEKTEIFKMKPRLGKPSRLFTRAAFFVFIKLTGCSPKFYSKPVSLQLFFNYLKFYKFLRLLLDFNPLSANTTKWSNTFFECRSQVSNVTTFHNLKISKVRKIDHISVKERVIKNTCSELPKLWRIAKKTSSE